MSGEAWFRNPMLFVRELVELNEVGHLFWQRGFLAKKRIDPTIWMQTVIPEPLEPRMLVAGEQGVAELDREHTMDKPAAVYPAWTYGHQDIETLVRLLEDPVGGSTKLCSRGSTPLDERPVFGQEHRVVILYAPKASTTIGRGFITMLAEMQRAYPEAIIHYSGTYSYSVAFGQGLRAADVNPHANARGGSVLLPNGALASVTELPQWQQWIHLLGWTVPELDKPRNRCLFNIQSAMWAAEHFERPRKFNSRHPGEETKSNWTRRKATREPGDLFLCNLCSLRQQCKYFRENAVCCVRGSEAVGLGKMFKSRDSGQIIEALGSILSAQADRLDRGMELEALDDEGKLDPEVTKLMNVVFGNGVKLAKLVDPKLNGGPLVGISIGQAGSIAAVQGAGVQTLTAAVVAQLEAKGVSREDITDEMIQHALGIGEPPIEASAELLD